jgi:light-regulated signal transduction histidine kinase (bacteriophytochrome)
MTYCMNWEDMASNDADDLESLPSRADRLLAAMHPVFSHDLPNQLVVVQSLATFLELEEMDALSPQAREYVTKLASAAKRAGQMVQFLKQMARLNGLDESVDTVQLAHLNREIRAAIREQFLDRGYVLDTCWNEPTVRAGRRSLLQACLETLRCGIDWCGEPGSCLRLRSRRLDTFVEVELAVLPRSMNDQPHAAVFRPEGPTLNNRLEMRLVQELVATWGGVVEMPPPSSEFLARVLIPLEHR